MKESIVKYHHYLRHYLQDKSSSLVQQVTKFVYDIHNFLTLRNLSYLTNKTLGKSANEILNFVLTEITHLSMFEHQRSDVKHKGKVSQSPTRDGDLTENMKQIGYRNTRMKQKIIYVTFGNLKATEIDDAYKICHFDVTVS